jgi:hypothetical protein
MFGSAWSVVSRSIARRVRAGRGAERGHLRGCMVHGRGRAPTQRPGAAAGRKGERDCTLLVWCRCEQRGPGPGPWRSRMLIPRFELAHFTLGSCVLLLRPVAMLLAEWLGVSAEHGSDTTETRTGSVKTTRRVARLESDRERLLLS